MASTKRRPNGAWRARYRDLARKEHAQHFDRKVDAQDWLDAETAKLVTGTWADPSDRKVTVGECCDLWMEGYARRASTVRQAEVHLAEIREASGLSRSHRSGPSQERSWIAKLRGEG